MPWVIAAALAMAAPDGGCECGLSLVAVTVRGVSAGLVPGVPALPGARVYEKHTEGPSGAGGSRTACAMPVVCSSIQSGKIWLAGSRAVVPGSGESGGRCAAACGFGELYGPVRGCPWN